MTAPKGTKEHLAKKISEACPGDRFVFGESKQGVIHVICENDAMISAVQEVAKENIPCTVAFFAKTPTEMTRQHIEMLQMLSDAERQSRIMVLALACAAVALVAAVIL